MSRKSKGSRVGVVTLLMMFALAAAGCVGGGSAASTGGAADANDVQVTGGAGGYTFSTGGVTVEIDAEAEPILSKIGEAQSVYEAPSCAFGDLDKIWTYSGFRIDTYQIDGVDYISDVIFTDDSVTTEEGLCIGNTVQDMRDTYGEPASEDSAQAVYLSGDMKLVFLLDGDTVKTIEYLNRKLES